ncbi:MAG: hypothetical protein RQ767_01455 [Thermovirgaceae bacterium]|nr:hypothetical protein [Thermovirgaceae bacterium]
MRKFVLLMLVLFSFASCALAADVEKMLEDRMVTLYPEGQLLGNMVIGARGKMEFIYVDRALANAIREDMSVPEWLSWHSRHWGTDVAKGKALFVIRYEAYKPWNFSTADIAIGGRALEKGDILTNKAYIIDGDITSGTIATLAIAVPADLASPGNKTVISYMEGSAEWTVPKK